MKELIEILKGKKQLVAIVAMWLLSTLKAESTHPGYITAVAIVAIAAQTFLDRKGEAHVKKEYNITHPLIAGNELPTDTNEG